tara:strand:+ start:1508 stop:1930 length:423 start_codon:yes stop_codon:yes gene_type:complete
MINTSNGHIQLPSYELTPELDTTELLQHLGAELNIQDMQTDWKWVTINSVELSELTFNFRLGFLNDKLTQLYFTFDTNESANWEAWNKAAELKKLELYQSWLKSELGANREFIWGTVIASFDGKAGFSSVMIIYNQDKRA